MNRLPMLALSAVVLCLPVFSTGAQADVIYASTNPTNNFGDFGTLNTVTGVYTPLGDNGVFLAGIGTENGVLFGMARGTAAGTLYSINTANGALTSIGDSNVEILDFGVTSSGLWAVGTDDKLYSINGSTGAASLIGATGIAATLNDWNSLSSGTSGLFFAWLDNLYSLDTSTGAATFIGCGGALAFGVCSGPQMGAMGDPLGPLFGVNNPDFGLYSVNTSTGSDTFIITITGASGAFNGLSPAPANVVTGVPEPITLSVFGAGLAGVVAARRRKKAAT